MFHLTVKKDSSGTLEEVEVNSAQKDSKGNNILNNYATNSLLSKKPIKKLKFSNKWETNSWGSIYNISYPEYIWTDGKSIYYSNGSTQYVFNKTNKSWEINNISGSLTYFSGNNIWTDGDNIYYSPGTSSSVRYWANNRWNTRAPFSGLSAITPSYIWTDGENTYHSNGSTTYILDKESSTWTQKSWGGTNTIYGEYIWTDGNDVYMSNGTLQYVLDKENDSWKSVTWGGVQSFSPLDIWTDGDNIYLSTTSGSHYVLDKKTRTWNTKTWDSFISNFSGSKYIWTDGDNVYYSYNSYQYVLSKENTIKSVLPCINSVSSQYVSKDSILDLTYPIGSIYMNYSDNTSPASQLGGTWTQISSGQFLLSTGTSYTFGSTGGEANVTLDVNQIPAHTHNTTVRLQWFDSGQTNALNTSWAAQSGNLKVLGLSEGPYASSTGGGQSHNNMPPYRVVSMWRRTA